MDLTINFPQPQHCSSPNTPSRTTVTFADHFEAIFVENLSLKYKPDLWLSSEEIDSILAGTVRSIQSIMAATNTTFVQFAEMNVNDTSAFMGLEAYLSPNTARMIRLRRRALWAAVLREQQRQRVAGICDPEAISIISEELSEKSRKRSKIIAMIHAPTTS
mmetsp:Transcript_15488/g.23498  ORF Transcript_15488/g.23498 Transcript_15488/m.23498 type:complete len:161 (+) Transcript_15488:127-609(+)|eukprot:CAMPEP_0196232780 /NCGR_PEP_ID=MMETSP0913-20130531/3342_1 /TAXON_ID=49265 /ORGANISM="Thalassiosira rotula, Strain GSO102" /LENGTH=160 /DNA_ID=CAMNT_0041513415 /DNA_START=79 /DNA_END=561 /DNA_ORIENTATION=-